MDPEIETEAYLAGIDARQRGFTWSPFMCMKLTGQALIDWRAEWQEGWEHEDLEETARRAASPKTEAAQAVLGMEYAQPDTLGSQGVFAGDDEPDPPWS